MNWIYKEPVEIYFKSNGIYDLKNVIEKLNVKKGLLVCDPFFNSNGLADKILEICGDKIFGVYSDITPNPKVSEVNSATKILKENNGDFVIGLGGGSAIDCGKAVCALASTNDLEIELYHTGGKSFETMAMPMIAIPTTSGTGSEVTPTAVLSNEKLGKKSPISNDNMFPKIALIDPVLTLTLPKAVTASTGLDVLAHCLEAYWSKNHQSICDAMAMYACKKVFKYLKIAYDDGNNLEAREAMSEASCIAGLAFGIPKTAASHGISFYLTEQFGMPHGEACAFTLDKLIILNSKADSERMQEFAKTVGFASIEDMAKEVLELKKYMKMRCTFAEIGVSRENINEFIKNCKHPLLNNNPVECTDSILEEMFLEML